MEIDFTVGGKLPRISRDRECFSSDYPWCIRGPGSAEFLGDNGWGVHASYNTVKGFATKEEAMAYIQERSDGHATLFQRLSFGAKTGPRVPPVDTPDPELARWCLNNGGPLAVELGAVMQKIRQELYPPIYTTIVGAIK